MKTTRTKIGKPIVKEIGFYAGDTEVGYVAWIKTKAGSWFVTLDGMIVGPH